MPLKSIILLLLLHATTFLAVAQQYFYCGVNAPDTLRRNEVSAIASVGTNTVAGFYGGLSASYRHAFTSHWTLGGSSEMLFGKQKFGIYAQAAYTLPVKRFNFIFSAKAMYNRYHRMNTNEFAYNLSANWEASYFNILVGASVIHYHLLKSSYCEPITFTFGAAVHIRPRTSSWNIGLFFRNYDEFYYENWNINWGIDWLASINRDLKLYGEGVIRPAGSMSQLATRYETSFKIGARYYFRN